MKMASIIVAAGDSDGTATNSSDTDANIFSDTQETIPLFKVKANTHVLGVYGFVETAFTASVTLTLGDSDAAVGYMQASNIGATTAGVGRPADSDALSSDNTDIYELFGGKFYSADQDINLVIGGADPATGRLRVIIKYSDLGSKSNLDTST
jgi:hypothetical protein